MQFRMKIEVTFLALAWVAAASSGVAGQAGLTARYLHENSASLRASVVKTFTLALGPLEKIDNRDFQWISLSATKVNGEHFRVWLLSSGYPPSTLEAARTATVRYLVQEGSLPPREYRDSQTGAPVLPAMGGWEYMMPRPVAGAAGELPSDRGFPNQVRYLGHRYVRETLSEEAPAIPPAARRIGLRPDLLAGPPHNARQKDETRRYDESDYEMVRLTKQDYRQMAEAGISCVAVDAEQAGWAEELNLFYWGAAQKASVSRVPLPQPVSWSGSVLRRARRGHPGLRHPPSPRKGPGIPRGGEPANRLQCLSRAFR